jgi:hypothetical protein
LISLSSDLKLKRSEADKKASERRQSDARMEVNSAKAKKKASNKQVREERKRVRKRNTNGIA